MRRRAHAELDEEVHHRAHEEFGKEAIHRAHAELSEEAHDELLRGALRSP